MTHELDKLDLYLQVPIGTCRHIVISHNNPAVINEKLSQYGVVLDKFGMVSANQKEAWKKLLQEAGIDKRYWKDDESTEPAPIELVPL